MAMAMAIALHHPPRCCLSKPTLGADASHTSPRAALGGKTPVAMMVIFSLLPTGHPAFGDTQWAPLAPPKAPTTKSPISPFAVKTPQIAATLIPQFTPRTVIHSGPCCPGPYQLPSAAKAPAACACLLARSHTHARTHTKFTDGAQPGPPLFPKEAGPILEGGRVGEAEVASCSPQSAHGKAAEGGLD